MKRGIKAVVLRGLFASALAALPAAGARPHAGPAPNLLDFNGGSVLTNPAIHNLYMDFSWDSDNPAAINKSMIDGFTASLVSSSYFAKAAQYGIGAASFTGSHDSSILCPPPIVDGITDFLTIGAWATCMTNPSPIPFTGTLTGIPAPDGNTVYSIYLPSGTQINDGIASSCGNFGAYHFFAGNLVWQLIFTPLPTPVLVPQTFAYTVIPIDCAVQSDPSNPLDGVSAASTHEIIEAATDPIILSGWINNSDFGFNADILKKGEASDICESSSDVRLTNGLLVAPYWSNADNACVPITRTIALTETGLPGTVAQQAIFDGGTVALPFSTVVDDMTMHSFSFPSVVNDPAPGIRYVTSAPSASLTVTSNIFRNASYSTQVFLTVQATPPDAATGDFSLTPSAWEPLGANIVLTTDALIGIDADKQFRFDHWSGDAAGTFPSTTVMMNAPKTAIANYASQHLVTVNSSGLRANNTNIFNGGTFLGMANDFTPLILFVDDGTFALSADANVNGSGGVQYFFQNFSPAPPGTLLAAFTTTATYQTVAQVIANGFATGGIFGPGAAGLASSYIVQFATVQADMSSGNDAQALLDLKAFISHVQAQAGKKVTPAFATMLQLDALLVYHDALCLAVGSGQIDATTANADYLFYSNLVSTLGGVVLPPC